VHETTKEAINITTPDTVMIYTNDAMDELFGYKKGELIGKQVSILNAGPAQEAKEVPKPIVDAIKKKGVWEGEIHNKRKDGTEFTSLAIITALTDKNGKIINYISTQHDITERKRAEEALRSSEERLKILFDFAPDAYYLNDLKGTFVDGNKAAEKITGYKRSELMGKSFLKLKLLSPKQIPKAAKLLAQNVLGKPTGPDEFTFIRKDGSRIALEISTVPMKIKGQTLVLGIARNITERKRAEEERERLLKELDAKTTEMERFTYTISHDLRSPLVTVQGFVEMLREDFGQNEREKVESDLKFIENGTTKMEHLLNDTLQLSRIGRMVNPPEDVSFGKIVQEAQVQTAQQIKSSGVEITVAEDFPAVHVDRMRIAEMLVNLITNSMNYMGEQPSPKELYG
jgi:PAS domain S-box-containing protein